MAQIPRFFKILLIFGLILTVQVKNTEIESDDTSESNVKHSSKKKITLLVENTAEKFNLTTSESKVFTYIIKTEANNFNKSSFLVLYPESKSNLKIDIKKDSITGQVLNSCDNKGEKSCVIDSANLSSAKQFFFIINCMELDGNCVGAVHFKIFDTQAIQINQPKIKKFQSHREETFTFSVNTPNAYSRYLLKLNYMNQHQMKKSEPIEVQLGEYLKGSEIKTAKSGTQQLLSFVIQGDKRTLDNYNYSFNLSTNQGAIVEITILAFHQNETEIKPGQEIYDFSYSSKNNNYLLKIPQYPDTKNYFLTFQLKTLTGDYKNIYIDSDDKSYDDFANYKWVINNQDESSVVNDYTEFLTLQKNEIENYMKEKKSYHIVVTGGQGIFELKVKLQRTLLNNLPMGQYVRDSLNPGQIKFYELLVFKPKSQEPNFNDSVSLEIEFMHGQAKVLGYSCTTNSSQCVGELLHSIIDKKQSINYTFALTSVQHQTTFHPQGCQSESQFYCQYLVAVVERDSQSGGAKYSLLAKQPNSLVDLPLNIPVDSFIHQGKNNYYRLWILNSKELKQITLKINTELNFYYSSDLGCEINEPCLAGFGNKFTPIVINLDNSSDSDILEYKVIVEGLKSTHYSLIAETQQPDYQNTIELWEGTSIHDFIPSNPNITNHYQFEINLKKKETIHVNLVSPQNSIEMQVACEGKKWFSKNGYLEINPRDKGYKEKGIYTISLYGTPGVEYEIVYTTQSTVKKLEKNVIEYGQVQPQDQKYYSLTFEKAIKNIGFSYFLTGETDQFDNSKNDLKMIISNEPYQLQDKIQNQQKEIFFSNGNSQLDTETIKQLCHNEKTYFCTLYLTVQNTGKQSAIKYGVEVKINSRRTKLMNGLEAKFAFSEIDNQAKTYYYIPSLKKTGQRFYITVGSMLGVMTNVTVRIFENGKKFLHDWSKFKNLKQVAIFSPYRQSHSIEINQRLLSHYQNALVVIHVISSSKYQLTELAPQVVDQINTLSDFGYIIVEENIVTLVTNRHVQFTLKPNQIRYFEYNLKRILSKNSSIVISLSQFYGNGLLMIQENNKTFHKIPTDYSDAKWLTFSGNLIISSKDIESKIDSNPKLVIAASSTNNEAGKFIISVMDKALSRITYNQPQEVSAGVKATRYFSYISYYGGMFTSSANQAFSIKLSKLFGKGTLSFYSCDTYDEVQCLQSKKKQKLDSLDFNQQQSQVILTQSNNCYGCLYLIKIHTDEELKGTLTVQISGVPMIIQPNNQITDTIDANEERIYQMYYPAKEEAQIIMGCLSGDLKLYASMDPFNQQQQFNMEGKPKADNNNFQIISINAIQLEEQSKTPWIFPDEVKEVYLTIKIVGNKQQSTYSLIVQTSKQFTILSNGVFTTFDIKPNETTQLLYHAQVNNETQPIQLFIQNTEDSPTAKAFNNKIIVESLHQAQPNFFGTVDPNSLNSVEAKQVVTTKSSIEVFLPQKKGVYQITIKNVDNNTLSISAMVTNKNLQMLPYNFKVSHLLYPQQSQYYEIFAPAKGVITLEMMMCSGYADIYTTSTYEQLMDQDQHAEIKMHNEFFKMIPVDKPGPVYLGITSLSDPAEDESAQEFYELSINFYKRQTQIPQTHFIMPPDAQINYEETKSNKTHHVIIDLPPLKCSKCEKFKLDSAFVDYQMYLGRTQDSLESNGVCVYMVSEDNNTMAKKSYQKLVEHMPLVASEEAEDIRFKFTVPIQDKYYVMAKATITGLLGQNKTEYEPFVVYYDPIEVNVNEPEDFEGNIFVRFLHPSLLQIVFWVVLVFGILFLLLMIARIINKRGGEEKQRLVKGEKSHLIKVLDSEGQGPTESFQSNEDAYQEDLQNEQKVKAKISEKYSQFYQPESIIE